MSQKFKKMILYLIIMIADFYLLPLVIKDTGSGMGMLLIVMPLVCFICSVIYGSFNSFNLLYPLLVIILFVPSLFIYYNTSAWIYLIAYGIIAVAGNLVGTIFYKIKQQ